MTTTDLLKEVRAYLEAQPPHVADVRLYMRKPIVPVGALTSTDNVIWDQYRAHLRQESKDAGLTPDREMYFVLISLRTRYQSGDGYRLGLDISLCKGCATSWAEVKTIKLSPQKDSVQWTGALKGDEPAACFLLENRLVQVYFYEQ